MSGMSLGHGTIDKKQSCYRRPVLRTRSSWSWVAKTRREDGFVVQGFVWLRVEGLWGDVELEFWLRHRRGRGSVNLSSFVTPLAGQDGSLKKQKASCEQPKHICRCQTKTKPGISAPQRPQVEFLGLYMYIYVYHTIVIECPITYYILL